MPDRADLFAEMCSDLLASDTHSAAQRLASEWPFHPFSETVYRSPSEERQLVVFYRDNFTCRYCGRRTVFRGVLQIINSLLPEVLPCHPNWKRSCTHPAFWELWTSCDHMVPISRGGSNELDNLATACYQCQDIKGHWLIEELRWELLSPSDVAWDGLVGEFVALCEQYRCNLNPSLMKWHRAIQSRR